MHFNEATQDYKLMVFFVPGFFEDHEGTNEMDYGINDRILSQYLQLLVITYL
ncbi:hypothetical protein RhiirA1_484841 [Rhizophagus irregularis]|uniref:Uncharacterized protein n=1 Tax=Rhizophagus irregularis TaxID=588596 RepID=A0A2N0QIX2_9GLOM|nr:hypothetical protein RhiirA1_484841 [Rhizophagus irregularis]